jgi:nucleotide-binding universal stress UspA family protein
MGRIVVGVDGSEQSHATVQWALEEARLRGATLEAVCSYQVPSNWLGVGEGMGATMVLPISDEDFAEYASTTLKETVAGVVGDDPGVEIITTIKAGHPGDVLVAASKDADLLVVGNRGHHDLSRVLLGSVGMHCVHHATCPVVVVRGNVLAS